jgi:hypothetical protein
VTHGGLEMLSETAGSRAGMRETLSDGALQRGRDERGRNPVLCAACHKPIRDADTGRPKRFCGDACRKRSHRRDQAKGIRCRAADDRSLTRDEAVMQLSYAIKTADGLRAGLDALVRIVAEERTALFALSLHERRDLAGRFVSALGLAPSPAE